MDYQHKMLKVGSQYQNVDFKPSLQELAVMLYAGDTIHVMTLCWHAILEAKFLGSGGVKGVAGDMARHACMFRDSP